MTLGSDGANLLNPFLLHLDCSHLLFWVRIWSLTSHFWSGFCCWMAGWPGSIPTHCVQPWSGEPRVTFPVCHHLDSCSQCGHENHSNGRLLLGFRFFPCKHCGAGGLHIHWGGASNSYLPVALILLSTPTFGSFEKNQILSAVKQRRQTLFRKRGKEGKRAQWRTRLSSDNSLGKWGFYSQGAGRGLVGRGLNQWLRLRLRVR